MIWVVILILIVGKSMLKENRLKLAEMSIKLLGSNIFAFHTDFRSYQALETLVKWVSHKTPLGTQCNMQYHQFFLQHIFLLGIDHYTVACSVAWPLNESEAGGDIVLRFLSKQGHLQPHFHSKARRLSTQL